MGRSRISNGTELLPGVDLRSTWARFMRDTYNSLVHSHLGGADYASEVQKMQCRRIATLEAELVHAEARIAAKRAKGEEPSGNDLDLYCRLGNAQRRHAEVLGWRPAQKDITPSLSTIIEQQAAEDAEVEGDG